MLLKLETRRQVSEIAEDFMWVERDYTKKTEEQELSVTGEKSSIPEK